MGWVLTGVLAGVYNAALWMLPVKKLGYHPSSILGGLLLIPFALVFRDIPTWLFLVSFLIWRSSRVQELRKEEGWDWGDVIMLIVFLGLMGYVYLNYEHGFVFSQLWR